MIYYHITEKTNLNSIKNKGLIPQLPHLPAHRELFKSFFKTEYVVYLLESSTQDRNNKYIQDTVYFKLWGKQRNLWGCKNSNWDEIYDMDWKIRCRSCFVILSVDMEIEKLKCIKAIHSQDNSLPCIKDMDMRYAHGDEPLVIIPNLIPSNKISEVGKVFPVIRNNTIQNIKVDWRP